MSRLSKFLGQGTCLADAPLCSPAVLRREAELERAERLKREQDTTLASAVPCCRVGRTLNLPFLKSQEKKRP